MLDLPQEMRDLLVEQLDEYLEEEAGSPDAEELAQRVIDALRVVVEELEVESNEDLLVSLESSGELEGPLLEVLGEQLEAEDLGDMTRDDLVAVLEKLCEIEWSDDDVDGYGVEELDEELDFDGDGLDAIEDEEEF